MRVITITDSDGYSYSATFDPNKLKDSEALHDVLCQYDPGDNYTVTFKNAEV